MEWVSAQPEPPESHRPTTSRIASFFSKPLQKSKSSRDLHQASTGYVDYTLSPYKPSPPISAFPSNYTPPTPFGFSSNKARINRALNESGRESKTRLDEYYVPYKGPISPPSAHNATFGSRVGDHNQQSNVDRRLYLHLDRHGRPVATYKNDQAATDGDRKHVEGLGLDYGGGADARQLFRNRDVFGAGLPSAYSHGGYGRQNTPDYPQRTMGYQTYIPSSMRFDLADDNSRIAAPAARVHESNGFVAHQPTYPFARQPASYSSSPAKSLTDMKAFPSLDTKANSISSSDGRRSCDVHEESATTSVTSFRDYPSTINSKSRASQDGPPPSSSTRQGLRSNTASSGSIRPKARGDERSDPAPAITRHVHQADSSEPRFESRQRTKSEILEGRRRRDPNEDHLGVQRLSPITASIPSQADAAALGHFAMKEEERSSPTELASTPAPVVEEARKRYHSLQQMHRQEQSAHAPDQSGWLDANSGCERVFMPKPKLRGKAAGSFESDQDDGREKQGSSLGGTFERHRRMQSSKSAPHLSDAIRAQEVISSSGYDSMRGTQSSLGTPLFHHRMPPPTPDVAASRQSHRPDHVLIPPRRSSQSRKRKTVSQTRSASTPKVAFLELDDDTPDVRTVLAQGRALDEERERWREQHRRSVGQGRARSTDAVSRQSRRDTLSSSRQSRQKKASTPIMPSLTPDLQRDSISKGGLRPSRSSPDLRRSHFEWQSDGASSVHQSGGCLDLQLRTPFLSRTAPKDQPSSRPRHIRQRSKSSVDLSSAFSCVPRLSRRRRATTMLPTSSEKGQAREAAAKSSPAADLDTPYAITRQSLYTDEGTSPELGAGPHTFKFPRKPAPSMDGKSDTYGIAFSAPRPDIGQDSAPKDPTFAAGRHATHLGYHRPSNSGDLRNMLLASIPYNESETGKAVGTSHGGRPMMPRNDSLGMTEIVKTLQDQKEESRGGAVQQDDEVIQSKSLPVPPRRQRSTNAAPTSRGMREAGSFGIQQRPQLGSQYTMPLAQPEDYTSPGAFFTPPLGPLSNMERREAASYFDAGSIGGSREDRTGKATGPVHGQAATIPKIMLQVPEDTSVVRKSTQSTLRSGTSSDDSGYSPRSFRAKELWNTDDHPEEAFTTLFFRKPDTLGRQRAQSSTSVLAGQDASKMAESQVTLGEATPRTSKESMYRTSLHAKRDSREIERMVGSYIDTISSEEGFDDAVGLQQEPAWNESTIDLFRQGTLRMGRVGDRRPELSPGYQRADLGRAELKGDAAEGDEHLTRSRQGSLSASVLMAADTPDGEDEEQEHGLGQGERASRDERISDASLANMVRDYLWPDPPKDGKDLI